MKKLLTLIAMFAIVVATFVSCEKDDEESLSNYIKITGEFAVGEKTYTNPTFDLGEPDLHIAYLSPMFQKTGNMIKVEPFEEFDLGNNIMLDYDYYIYGETLGEQESSAYIAVYIPIDKSSGFWIYSNEITTKLTRVGEVGGYIEGEFEGSFYPEKKSVESYPVKGKFKVKRIEYQGPL